MLFEISSHNVKIEQNSFLKLKLTVSKAIVPKAFEYRKRNGMSNFEDFLKKVRKLQKSFNFSVPIVVIYLT